MQTEEIKRLLRFLARRLQESKHEITVYRAAILNLPPAFQEKVAELQSYYRESEEIKAHSAQDVEGFDELIEQIHGDQHQKASQELLRLLEVPTKLN